MLELSNCQFNSEATRGLFYLIIKLFLDTCLFLQNPEKIHKTSEQEEDQYERKLLGLPLKNYQPDAPKWKGTKCDKFVGSFSQKRQRKRDQKGPTIDKSEK